MNDLRNLPKIKQIRFESVSFKHDDGYDPTLHNVDFDFPTDQFVWIKSSEGAGKSTLLQIMAGLLIPQSGQYLINEINITEMSFEEFLPFRLAIGYTFDYGGLISNRSIKDNMLLPLLYHKIISEAEAHERVDQLIKRFDLKKYQDERPAHVPGRVRKLSCLLRTMVIKPQMLLLDDPSIGLGHETSLNFADLINDMRDEGFLQHIFVSSYDDKFMNLFPHQIIHLDQGQIYSQQLDAEKKVVHL